MSKSILKSTSFRPSQRNPPEGTVPDGRTTEGSDSDSSLHGTCEHATTATMSLHHVHFATDTSVYLTHSNTDYDRSPMKVAKNPCAMPARGCPGLTYLPMDDGPRGRQRGVRDMDVIGICLGDGSEDEGSEADGMGRTEHQTYPMEESGHQTRERGRSRVTAQRRDRDVFPVGFRSLSTFSFSSLVSSPNDCFGGF